MASLPGETIENSEIYSAEPQKTNKIINGKVAYRAVIETTLPKTSANGTLASGNTDISHLGATSTPIIEYSYFSNGGRNFPLPLVGGYSVYAFVDKNKLYLQNYIANYNEAPIVVSLLFNKD